MVKNILVTLEEDCTLDQRKKIIEAIRLITGVVTVGIAESNVVNLDHVRHETAKKIWSSIGNR